MIFAAKHRAKELTDFSISFGGKIIHDTPYANNLGAYFDRTLSMENQCNVIARSCFFHIRNIGCIRHFISEDACKMLVNALVIYRLDYGNALLYGITTKLTDKFQRVHSTPARLITRTKKTDHITPVLSPRFLCRPTTFFLFARAVGRSKKTKVVGRQRNLGLTRTDPL